MQPRQQLLMMARVWAYPMWLITQRSDERAAVDVDVDWWMTCINDPELVALSHYSRFAYLTGALPEFRTLLHYRLRSLSSIVRMILRFIYRPAPTLTLNANHIGPGLFIQHGLGTIVTAQSIGSYCWINQQVTIGHTKRGRPVLGNHVRVAAGAVVIGPITLHDGVTVGANATVVRDVPAGAIMVAPVATPLGSPPSVDDDAPA